MPEQLIGVTRSVNIKFVIKGPVGGLGSRSLLWFLPRFPAPILVRFFLASECPMWRIRARLALYCMSWGIQPPLSVVCLVWVRNKDSAGYRGTLHDSPNRCCVLSFLCAVNSTENPLPFGKQCASVFAFLHQFALHDNAYVRRCSPSCLLRNICLHSFTGHVVAFSEHWPTCRNIWQLFAIIALDE